MDTVEVDCTNITFIFRVLKIWIRNPKFLMYSRFHTVFKNQHRMSNMNFHAKIKFHTAHQNHNFSHLKLKKSLKESEKFPLNFRRENSKNMLFYAKIEVIAL